MNNAELIAELRGHILSVPLTLLHDAADALEAADKRIAELMPKEGEWMPVVRCLECRHNKGEKVWRDGEVTIDCDNGMGYPPPNFFCADGERRTER